MKTFIILFLLGVLVSCASHDSKPNTKDEHKQNIPEKI